MPMIDLNDTSESNQAVIAVYCAENVLRGIYATKIVRRRFEPFTSADDDYAVLVHVRATWPDSDGKVCFCAFCNRLKAIWLERADGIGHAVRHDYIKGDYTIAACRVIQQQREA